MGASPKHLPSCLVATRSKTQCVRSSYAHLSEVLGATVFSEINISGRKYAFYDNLFTTWNLFKKWLTGIVERLTGNVESDNGKHVNETQRKLGQWEIQEREAPELQFDKYITKLRDPTKACDVFVDTSFQNNHSHWRSQLRSVTRYEWQADCDAHFKTEDEAIM